MDESKISIERAEGQVEGLGYATELLKQLKETSKRLWWTVWGLAIALVVSNLIWLYVFQSYEYSSSYEYSATGVNAIIDNSGNVVAQDIPDDKLIEILEILKSGNGEIEGGQNPN